MPRGSGRRCSTMPALRTLELQAAASLAIARAYGCEAGCVTGCTAGSISISVAAAMTGRNFGRVEQLPDTTGMKNEVIVPKAHVVSYGHDVTQSVRITGAKTIEVGFATELSRYQIEHAIGKQPLHCLSYHTSRHRIKLQICRLLPRSVTTTMYL